MNEYIRQLLKSGEQNFLPSLSVDCVIFGFHENQLKVLLLRHRYLDIWALPGGFVYKDEPTESAAKRVLRERTGLDEIFLQQFSVFGEPRRSSREFHLLDLEKDGINVSEDHWLLQRFVTIGYYALVDFSKINLLPETAAEKSLWWDINDLPEFMFDHKKILDKALETLRMQLNYQPIGYNLLPEKFTMTELQKLYETILDKNLDKRNFQRKILGYQILRRLKEKKKGVPHKSPYLHTFDLEKYNDALDKGFNSGW